MRKGFGEYDAITLTMPYLKTFHSAVLQSRPINFS